MRYDPMWSGMPSMCDGSYQHRAWRFYVQDMLEFAEKVLVYTDGMDLEAFLSDEQTYDATLHNILLIGEAASHVPMNVRDAYLDVPWQIYLENLLGRSVDLVTEKTLRSELRPYVEREAIDV